MDRVTEMTIDFAGPKKPFPHFWEVVIGSEGADFPLREDLLSHYEDVREKFGVQYVRFHGILHDNLGIYKEDSNGTPEFNFKKVDKLYDNLLDIGIRPFVEFSFMPEALASKDTHIFFWRGNTSPPKDYKKWEALIRAFVEHFVKRYGKKEVRRWYFEIWNEPNIGFWSGTQEDYWRLYDHSVKAIKEIDPYLKVGGPASAGGEWIKEILEHCTKENLATGGSSSPIDFVSYHGYPTDRGYIVGGEPFEYFGIDFWRELAKLNYEIVKSFDKSGEKEIHVTEWNMGVHLWDIQQCSSNGAAYCCQAINDVCGYVDTFSYWTVSDIFREMGFPDKEFHGGFGLITIHGLKKPKYWAFELLHRLNGPRIPVSIENPVRGVGAIATKQKDGLAILVWHFDSLYYNSVKDIQQNMPVNALPDLEDIQQKTLKEPVKCKIRCLNLPTGKIKVTRAIIDEEHSNILNTALKLGINLNSFPDDKELTKLKELNTLYEEKTQIEIDSKYEIELSLTPGSVIFIGLEGLSRI